MRRWFARLPIILLLAHVYVAVRLAVPAGGIAAFAGAALMLACYVAVLIGFSRRRSQASGGSDVAAWAGFLALGLFSSLFVLTLLRDVVLCVWVLGSFAFGLHGMPEAAVDLSRRAIPWLALVFSAVGLVNARRRAPVLEVDVRLPGLPSALAGFTIVQLTDIHVGPTIKRGYVQAMVDAANAQQADAIVITGDVVDGSVQQLTEHTRPLGELQARHGVFLVTGNHEYYAGADAWVAEFRRLGLTVLLNEHVVIQQGNARLVMAGVTDFNAAGFSAQHASDPARAAAGAPAGVPRILLAHQPRTMFAAEPAGFDLQLSGHTHGGQFLPWNWFVPLQQPVVAGLHRHGAMQVYVSRGTGYWGPPLRLGARSEITRLRLLPA